MAEIWIHEGEPNVITAIVLLFMKAPVRIEVPTGSQRTHGDGEPLQLRSGSNALRCDPFGLEPDTGMHLR